MKNVLLLLTVVLFASHGYAQKVKIKDEMATVDGSDYVQWKKQMIGSEVSVYAPGSEDELIFIKYQSYSTATNGSNNDPAKKVSWVDIKFLTLDITCEVDSRTHKGLVRLLYDNKVIANGELNEANAKKFVSKYGTTYSDNRPSSVIIVTD